MMCGAGPASQLIDNKWQFGYQHSQMGQSESDGVSLMMDQYCGLYNTSDGN